MFERRARIVLACLVATCGLLLLRAGQLQVAQAGQWDAVAGEALRRSVYSEPGRGRILDRQGRVLAEDVPCNDAAVAYWFVRRPADDDYLERLARDLARLTPGYYEAETGEQVRRVEAMLPQASAAVDRLFDQLASIGDTTRQEVEARRDVVIERVRSRREHLVESRWRRATESHEAANLGPWWRRFLLGDGDAPPVLADFDEPIAEEQQAHLILADLTNEQYNGLLKLQASLPPTLADALVLRASRTRRYPMGPVASHVVGRIAQVSAQDVAADPHADDERRRYLPGDPVGKSGLERAAEQSLRGRRGRIDLDLVTDAQAVAHERENGGDVTTTLDAALTADVRDAFGRVDFRWPAAYPNEPAEDRTETGPMPGAAVVIELETGAVLAMASLPDFDPNLYDEQFAELRDDQLGRRLVNRATRFACEPGSTVKPLVGLGAITAGLLDGHGTVPCTGYLTVEVRGEVTRYSHTGRCWTAKMYGHVEGVQGHQTWPDPHPTPGLNPDADPPAGHLTLADALQRSCNVFFETLGHRGGTEQLSDWLAAFGLGRPTGLELADKGGSLPRDITDRAADADGGMGRVRNNWFGSIGQGFTQATPVQMANAVAALARGGVWMPATLLDDGHEVERIDLELDPDALDMARRGMAAVVHTPGGSGNGIDARLPLRIGAKTGSAQAHLLTVAERDDDGNAVLGTDGRPVWRRIDDLSVRGNPNPAAPWYRRGNDPADPRPEVTHGWFVGYAPADEPRYAFAVLVEYGGSGGVSAGSVAAQVVQAMVKHGYLEAEREVDPEAPPGEARYVVEPAPL